MQTDDQRSPFNRVHFLVRDLLSVRIFKSTPEWSRLGAIASFMTLCLLKRISNASVADPH